MRRLEDVGFDAVANVDSKRGDIVVVNTCRFIGDAKEESINTILECVEAKRRGQVERIYVMGCLSERYLDQLAEEISEVDGWYGKFNLDKIIDELSSKNSLSVFVTYSEYSSQINAVVFAFPLAKFIITSV